MRPVSSLLRFPSLVLLLVSVLPPCAAAQEKDESAFEVQVVTHRGARFSGVIPAAAPLGLKLEGKDALDPASLPPDLEIRLQHVNGLDGSMGVKVREVASIKVLGKLDSGQVADAANKVKIARDQLWAKESERLAKVNASRAAKKQAEAEAATAAADAAAMIPTLDAESQEWIDRFPPSEGFVPAKKEEIYHQTVILNNRYPTDREREWLDNYDAWKSAYDAWLKIEDLKIANEEKAKAEKAAGKAVELPTGDDRSDPSGTASSGAASIDPDHPTAADAQKLPPAISSVAKKPRGIDKAVAAPEKLATGVPKPAKLANGTDP